MKCNEITILQQLRHYLRRNFGTSISSVRACGWTLNVNSYSVNNMFNVNVCVCRWQQIYDVHQFRLNVTAYLIPFNRKLMADKRHLTTFLLPSLYQSPVRCSLALVRSNRVPVIADLFPIFNATISNATRLQVHFTQLH